MLPAADFAATLRAVFSAHADPARAAPMAAYMKHRFDYFGLPTPLRRALQKPLFAPLGKTPPAGWLIDVAEALWAFPERECQYAACDLLVKFAGRLSADEEPRLAACVRARAWWDTVDMLATRVFGPLVARDPALLRVMDRYATHDDLWLRRVAILYPLHFKAETDTERLTRILDANLGHPDFFIRKAMGWVLRQVARTDPVWVRLYVATRGERVAPLTRREALKHL